MLTLIFCITLVLHFWLATRNWTMGFMPGHEFRQAQTAFISHFIDRENDFSLLYEAPIVGKPWVSILLEVPVYEWTVVLLSRAAEVPHVVAARTVSLACFYLCLPAFWLLLGRFGVAGPRRLLTLSLILLCPIHIFYSRAFLMESMELMCCAWFLFGYVWMMDRRRWFWFLLATVAGTGAALIKSATLAVWLIPAAAYAGWMLWDELRRRAGVGALLQTVFWGLAGVTVPLAALGMWIRLTDPLKAAHAAAWIFTSKNLSVGNWGLQDISARFSAKTWGTLLERWSEALMPPWLIVTMLLAGGLAFPAQRRRIAGLAAVFFLAQLLFPYAYAYQEYYFYACAVYLLAGLGFVLHGVLDSRLPRAVCWVLVAVLPAAQLHTYWRVYYPQQMVVSPGGFSYTEALRDLTPRESVIVVAGADWASMIPLYSQRRALMVINGMVNDRTYLGRAFSELGDEEVSALVLVGDQRGNAQLRELATEAFALEPGPTFRGPHADIYCARRLGEKIRDGLRLRGHYGDLTVPEPTPPRAVVNGPVLLDRGPYKNLLQAISPRPIRGRFAYGLGTGVYEGAVVTDAHPESDLWVKAPPGATRIEWDFGMISSAWDRDGGKTDGVEMILTTQRPGEERRVVFRRVLDPVAHPGDRGLQQEVIPHVTVPGELLCFSSRPRGHPSYDWAYWARIHVK